MPRRAPKKRGPKYNSAAELVAIREAWGKLLQAESELLQHWRQVEKPRLKELERKAQTEEQLEAAKEEAASKMHTYQLTMTRIERAKSRMWSKGLEDHVVSEIGYARHLRRIYPALDLHRSMALSEEHHDFTFGAEARAAKSALAETSTFVED